LICLSIILLKTHKSHHFRLFYEK
jgi:hypothetical protein